MLHTFNIVDYGSFTVPLKVFADDIALYLTSDVSEAIALRATGGCASVLPMRFNMEKSKSVELIDHERQQKVCHTLGGDALRV